MFKLYFDFHINQDSVNANMSYRNPIDKQNDKK